MSIRVADWWRDTGEGELRALLREWDPIGVMHFDPPPLDEYDHYLAPVFFALRAGGDATDVRRALTQALGNMGLSPAGPREDETAARIVRWWQESFPGGE